MSLPALLFGALVWGALWAQTPAPAPAGHTTAPQELELGNLYLNAKRWNEAAQHCSAAIEPARSPDPAAVCLHQALDEAERERRARLQARLWLVDARIRGDDLDTAQKELERIRTDYQSGAQTVPLRPDDEKIVAATADRLARKREEEWPNWLPPAFSWIPGLLTNMARIAAITLILSILYGLLVGVRFAWRSAWRFLRTWRWSHSPVDWRVWPITDQTGQAAAGALMDALQVRSNPLFQPLPVSSYLALPPSLSPAMGADENGLMLRDFFPSAGTQPAFQVRAYLSEKIESLKIEEFTKHTFSQVQAFEEMNLKLGVVEASFGAITRNIVRWWMKKRPALTGSVAFEKLDGVQYASVRLVCNYEFLPESSLPGAAPAGDVNLRARTKMQTLYVYASSRVEEMTDAVGLASQRAAFRLVYRLVIDTSNPNLAVAASCYRQGIRLLR